ncbi:MAG: sodium:proton antiporter [Bdellovibrionales bacterium]|nr:sodium:proton antiporter [Bdellovibrionales bacterium]
MDHAFINEFSIIIFIGISLHWLSWWVKVPPIILWMVSGWLAGPALGWIEPVRTFDKLFHPLVELASAIILFEGGLSLRRREFNRVGEGIRRLISIGLVLHFLFITMAGYFVANWSLQLCLVVSSILIVTGPTVVTPVIKQIHLKKRTSIFLKWEAILNDPIGALMAVIFFQYWISSTSNQEHSFLESISLAITISLALAIGFSSIIYILFNRNWVPHFLKVPLSFSLIFVSYTAANYIQQGAGLLAVTLFGLLLGNIRLPMIDEVKKFKVSISTFLLSILFISLSSTIDIREFKNLQIGEWLFVLLILFGLRPLAIMLATARSDMSLGERAIISWFAPRGIVAASVAAVLGHQLEAVGLIEGHKLVPIIFAVIFLSVLIYGMTLQPLANFFQLTEKSDSRILMVADSVWAKDIAEIFKEEGYKVRLITNKKVLYSIYRGAYLTVSFGNPLKMLDNKVVELDKVSVFIALTKSNYLNSLLCSKFTKVTGSSNAFQIQSRKGDSESPESLPMGLRGKLITEDLSYEEIERSYRTGRKFKLIDSQLERFQNEESVVRFAHIQENGVEILTHKNAGNETKGRELILSA